MPKYKVILEAPTGNGNPFNPTRIDLLRTRKVRIREWRIEAASEKQIRDFYEEAKAEDLPNVQGFFLRSIDLIDPAADGTTQPTEEGEG